MPKVQAHFDYAGLCEQVLAQPFGLVVSTNNPAGFRRVLYKHMRQEPAHRLHILADPASPARFYLLRSSPETLLENPHGEG